MTAPPPDPERARLDRLMSRMLGGLLLLGAGVLLPLTLLVARLPHATIDGAAVLLLPGTDGRHGLSPLAAPVLGIGALILALAGLAALAMGRHAMPSEAPERAAARAPSFRRPALVLLAGIALLIVVLLRR